MQLLIRTVKHKIFNKGIIFLLAAAAWLISTPLSANPSNDKHPAPDVRWNYAIELTIDTPEGPKTARRIITAGILPLTDDYYTFVYLDRDNDNFFEPKPGTITLEIPLPENNNLEVKNYYLGFAPISPLFPIPMEKYDPKTTSINDIIEWYSTRPHGYGITFDVEDLSLYTALDVYDSNLPFIADSKTYTGDFSSLSRDVYEQMKAQADTQQYSPELFIGYPVLRRIDKEDTITYVFAEDYDAIFNTFPLEGYRLKSIRIEFINEHTIHLPLNDNIMTPVHQLEAYLEGAGPAPENIPLTVEEVPQELPSLRLICSSPDEQPGCDVPDKIYINSCIETEVAARPPIIKETSPFCDKLPGWIEHDDRLEVVDTPESADKILDIEVHTRVEVFSWINVSFQGDFGGQTREFLINNIRPVNMVHSTIRNRLEDILPRILFLIKHTNLS